MLLDKLPLPALLKVKPYFYVNVLFMLGLLGMIFFMFLDFSSKSKTRKDSEKKSLKAFFWPSVG